MTIYGWARKILRVDLTAGNLATEDTLSLTGRFVGGRGLAAWIGWREIPPEVDAFSPENRLILMTSPLTGTLAPASGRLEVCGKAPQAYPRTHYTRSSMGGHWGPELKYAGYDGIVIHGKAASPVYLWIEDEYAELADAGWLWGLDAFEAQKKLIEEHGKGAQVCCIGPAGENLVRIAVIQSGLENAAGQGGFGAVMGSKNLKAIAVKGTGSVGVARPEELRRLFVHVKDLRPPPKEPQRQNKACSMACSTHCSMRVYRKRDGEPVTAHCCSPGVSLKPQEEGLEVELLCDKYGLNRWEINWMGFGRGSWFHRAKEAGALTDEDFGMPLQLDSPRFWRELVRMIAYREGVGEALAEGMPRAARALGKAWEYLPHVGHGYAAHWDGHLYGYPRYPHWIVSALTWAMDTRDPIVHCYAQEIARWYGYGTGRLGIKAIEDVSEKVYGSRQAVAMESGYEYKAQPTIWHQNRDVIKDSLPVCDQMGFPPALL
ncbi:MAG: aldehyde ferredoxin oxidoreductase N-terminal domain-containing protein [Candidatus Bathyarchaeia archaeon]